MTIESTLLVHDVMRRWPATIRIFIAHRMHCAGCPIAGFHALDEACKEYGIDPARFMADLKRAAAGEVAPEWQRGSQHTDRDGEVDVEAASLVVTRPSPEHSPPTGTVDEVRG